MNTPYKQNIIIKAPIRNKNGIPVFEKNQDMSSFFINGKGPIEEAVFNSASPNDTPTSIEPKEIKGKNSISGENGSGRKKNHKIGRNSVEHSLKDSSKLKKNRHGIPFLDGKDSLSKMFNSHEKEFSHMLDSSLRGKSRSAMLREKKDKLPVRPMPLKKRLKRYPPPQENLDLHGYTALEAQSFAKHYLRKMWRNGFFTLNIIVGKGLHSEAGAVLPDVVEEILIRLKKEKVVLWFEWDRHKKSSSGAVIVYLKQFD